jgi:LexA DNA binding domain
MQNHQPFTLSERALAEYKKIYQEQFGDRDFDEEICASAYNLMRLFRLLLEPSPQKARDGKIGVMLQEFTALKYLHHAIYHKGEVPSVRDVCAAMGFRSSRSGQVMIEKLMKKGFVYRHPAGRIQLSGLVRGCDANLWELAVRDKK